MLGPHQSTIYFALTKSVNSIITNYKIWFLLILKHFLKNKRDVKMACQEEEWEQIFIGKWDFWNLKIPMRKWKVRTHGQKLHVWGGHAKSGHAKGKYARVGPVWESTSVAYSRSVFSPISVAEPGTAATRAASNPLLSGNKSAHLSPSSSDERDRLLVLFSGSMDSIKGFLNEPVSCTPIELAACPDLVLLRDSCSGFPIGSLVSFDE